MASGTCWNDAESQGTFISICLPMSCFLEFWLLLAAYCDHLITIVALSIMVQIYISEVCFFCLSSHKLLFDHVYSADIIDHWHV